MRSCIVLLLLLVVVVDGCLCEREKESEQGELKVPINSVMLWREKGQHGGGRVEWLLKCRVAVSVSTLC